MAESAKVDNFWSRLDGFLAVSHPRYMIATEADIRNAQAALKNPNLDAASRKQHQLMVDATVHPASGDIIPWAVRVSGIAPVNIPIIFAMIITPATNIPGTLFMHWTNQSYNAVTNFYHRSGKDFDLQSALKAYGLAVGSACTLAYGLGKAYERAPPSIKKWGVLIPCLATAAANVSNLVLTRADEAVTGAMVTDAEGKEWGKSKVAGYTGLAQTASTRAVMLPASCLLLPPAVEALASKLKVLPTGNVPLTLFRLTLIYLSLQGALPACLAVFPQKVTYDVNELEEQFRNLKDSKGQPIKTLYSNKGL